MLSDEEKKAINLLKSYENKLVYEISEKDKKAVKTILNLIEKQSKEIEGLIKVSKECIEEKFNNDKKWEDKIKAIIEELEKDIQYSANPSSIDNSKFGIKVLQSLLEKE